MRRIPEEKVRQLVEKVLAFYVQNGRHDLPWRKTVDPYAILVSEIMLQQTQVARVVPKYEVFLRRFPTVHFLAAADLADVLRLWQGLGYNRRAKYLHEAAKEVVARWNGVFPNTCADLQTLSGVGLYTAGAVCAFAYDTPVAMVETNIRTVVIYECFPKKQHVEDVAVHGVMLQALRYVSSPRVWYWACMDYGSALKSSGVVVHRQSAHHSKQAPFAGSDRQVRGAIVRAIAHSSKSVSIAELQKALDISAEKEIIAAQCTALKKDGLLRQNASGKWFL